MKEPSVTHSTFVVERNYPVSPERVFEAFANPQQKRRWYAGGDGPNLEIFETDFRVGGRETARSKIGGGPLVGQSMTCETVYHDIQPNRRVVVSSTMDIGDKRISASLTTIELLPGAQGTDLIFTEQGAFFEGSDTPAMREGGWRALLDRLGKELA